MDKNKKEIQVFKQTQSIKKLNEIKYIQLLFLNSSRLANAPRESCILSNLPLSQLFVEIILEQDIRYLSMDFR